MPVGTKTCQRNDKITLAKLATTTLRSLTAVSLAFVNDRLDANSDSSNLSFHTQASKYNLIRRSNYDIFETLTTKSLGGHLENFHWMLFPTNITFQLHISNQQ